MLAITTLIFWNLKQITIKESLGVRNTLYSAVSLQQHGSCISVAWLLTEIPPFTNICSFQVTLQSTKFSEVMPLRIHQQTKQSIQTELHDNSWSCSALAPKKNSACSMDCTT